MVNIQKNNITFDEKRGDKITAFLLAEVRRKYPNNALAIAVSGGVDSMSLLYAACIVAKERNLKLHALHVHHNLQSVADDWVTFVEQYCAANDISFLFTKLDSTTRINAQSIEDWARAGRYKALADMAKAQGIADIWVAQHQDDQIETHLLQKARGAGARGLSSMPEQFVKDGLDWHRPWLNVSREQIEIFAQKNRVDFCVDPSNKDIRFARNALRASHNEFPMGFEQRNQILSDIRLAQTQLAQEKLWATKVLESHTCAPHTDIGERARLENLDLNEYTEPQQALIVRQWLSSMNVRMPTRAALKELIKQLNNNRIDQHMCWQHTDGIRIARFRNVLIATSSDMTIDNGHIVYLPKSSTAYGIDENLLLKNKLSLRKREGGERIRLHPKRPSITLKLAYQNAGIAPILRAHLPLVYCGDHLVFAAGIGMNIDRCVLGGIPISWKMESTCCSIQR